MEKTISECLHTNCTASVYHPPKPNNRIPSRNKTEIWGDDVYEIGTVIFCNDCKSSWTSHTYHGILTETNGERVI